MARLGLDIDLALQRLLGANKERAAANRAELDDRQRRKDAAAEKVQIAASAPRPGSPTSAEEIRGGTPQLYRPDEPTAQRRKKKKGVEVFGVQRLAARPQFGSEVNYSRNWTRTVAQYNYSVTNVGGAGGTYVYELTSPVNYATNTETNSYSKQTTEWQPEFNQELNTSRKFWIAPKHTLQDRITAFNWTYRQQADVFFADGYEIDAEIPALPFRLQDIKSARTFDAYVSSDGTYIYVSHLVGVFTPGLSVTSGTVYGVNDAADPDVYWTGYLNSDGSQQYDVTTGERFFSRTFVPAYDKFSTPARSTSDFFPGSMFGLPDTPQHSIEIWYGLYWRFNIRQPATPELRVDQVYFTVGDRASSTPDGEAGRAFFETMHPSDPIYRLFQAQAAGYTSLLTEMLIDDFLNSDDSFYKRWPPGLVYDEERGYLTLVTTLPGWTTPRIFTKQVGQITYGYANIPIIELPSNFDPYLTTEEQMLDRGWVNEGLIPQNTLDPLEQYFAFKS